MNKYAMDLTGKDVIVQEEGPRFLVIDFMIYDEDEETILIEGYYDDNGDEFSMVLDPDDEVRTTTLDSIVPF